MSLPSSDFVHTYPNTDEHITSGLDCWCGPLYLLPCDECNASGCWKCTDGCIELTRSQAEHTDRPLVVVHSR